MVVQPPNNIVHVNIPIVNHSWCEEIFSTINMIFLQFHWMTSGVVVPKSGEH